MKRYDSIISIIIGVVISSLLPIFLPDIPISDILIVFIIIFSGFIATYLSRNNKAINGFYMGIILFVGCLPLNLIYGPITFKMILFLILIPILGFIGGYLAKMLRLYEIK